MNKDYVAYRLMQFSYCYRRIAYKCGKHEFLPEGALDIDSFNTFIAELITSGKPCMVARFGSQEARATAWALGVDRGYDTSIPEYVQNRMAVGPGFFPADDQHIRRFGLLMQEAAQDLDALAYWDSFMQQWLLEEVCPDGVATSYLENLEPYRNQDNPWTAALVGKRVLVVHPFASSIRKQYAHRQLLFKNVDLLPEFELLTLVPPQTIAGNVDSRFGDWFEALAYLEAQVDAIDYDIALIGCGAYGFPLASHVKRSGRQAVHGGVCSRCCLASRAGAGTSSRSRRSYTTRIGSGRVRASGLRMCNPLRTLAIGKDWLVDDTCRMAC